MIGVFSLRGELRQPRPGHAAGLAAWGPIVADEAHRVSGRIRKPWAVVHDSQKVPSLRRGLCMTATPRLWQRKKDAEGPFGSRAFTLTLSEAIDREGLRSLAAGVRRVSRPIGSGSRGGAERCGSSPLRERAFAARRRTGVSRGICVRRWSPHGPGRGALATVRRGRPRCLVLARVGRRGRWRRLRVRRQPLVLLTGVADAGHRTVCPAAAAAEPPWPQWAGGALRARGAEADGGSGGRWFVAGRLGPPLLVFLEPVTALRRPHRAVAGMAVAVACGSCRLGLQGRGGRALRKDVVAGGCERCAGVGLQARLQPLNGRPGRPGRPGRSSARPKAAAPVPCPRGRRPRREGNTHRARGCRAAAVRAAACVVACSGAAGPVARWTRPEGRERRRASRHRPGCLPLRRRGPPSPGCTGFAACASAGDDATAPTRFPGLTVCWVVHRHVQRPRQRRSVFARQP